jgi:hypothetical protein
MKRVDPALSAFSMAVYDQVKHRGIGERAPGKTTSEANETDAGPGIE